jgi:hypothetical protein
MPVEVAVVAADTATSFQNDQVWVAGATGFLHRYTNSSALLWTRYADGATTVLSDLTGVNSSTLVYAGGDTVATTAQVPGHSAPDALTVLDLAQRSWRQLPMPTTGTYLAFYGSTMIVRAPAGTTGNPLSLRQYAAEARTRLRRSSARLPGQRRSTPWPVTPSRPCCGSTAAASPDSACSISLPGPSPCCRTS